VKIRRLAKQDRDTPHGHRLVVARAVSGAGIPAVMVGTPRTRWSVLPAPVREAVEGLTGPIRGAGAVKGGHNNELAVRLDTDSGPVFVKGLRTGHPRLWTQEREAALAAHLTGLGPPVLWRVRPAGGT